MEFLKKNGLVILSLSLCAVLTAALVRQSAEVGSLRAELAEEHQTAEHLAERLDETDTVLQSLQASQDQRPISVSFANPTVNTRDRMLTVDVIAQFPDEDEYGLMIGFCQVGEPYRMAWKLDYLQRNKDGTYMKTVTFPLDLEMGLELRLEDDTVIFSSDSIVELLPVQLKHGGTSWHYNSQEQKLYQCDWGVALMDPAGNEVQALDGEFRVYRNGTLVFTGRQMPDNSNVEVDGEIMLSVGLDCPQGDCMRLCYACTDAFGLRYEFPIFEKLAMRWDNMEEVPLSRRPTVTWPE